MSKKYIDINSYESEEDNNENDYIDIEFQQKLEQNKYESCLNDIYQEIVDFKNKTSVPIGEYLKLQDLGYFLTWVLSRKDMQA